MATEPTMTSWASRAHRFGPRAQPFFSARFSDDTSAMVAGLSPDEIPAFLDQHHEAGLPREQARETLLALARGKTWVDDFIAIYEAAEAAQNKKKAVLA